MIKPMGKILIVTPGRTKSFAVLGVPEKTLRRKEASLVGRVVVRFVLRTERETMGRRRDCKVVLQGVSHCVGAVEKGAERGGGHTYSLCD